ncbi:MAG: Na(+)/H(+) antiporter subunit B [Spirochaetota bacterium]|nr:Na(+)/H(+) antiporter subunit B [Spirochaetota bacterium]
MIRKYDNIIIQTVGRIMIPFMQVYSLYVLVHGHGSPGGGFQGGCILAASFILMAVAYDIEEINRRFKERRVLLLCSLGVFLYVGTGFLCMFCGGNFLDYGFLSKILPTDEIMARYYGMAIIETGVQITVMAVMVTIFLDLATSGKHEGMLKE